MKLYTTLGVAPAATQTEIKAAFRRKAKDAHPDREGGSTEAMAAINEAYAVLGDPERRARYDATGDTREAPKPPTIEEEGAKALAEVFNDCLTQEGDILKVMRNAFNEGIDMAQRECNTFDRLLGKLKARRGLVVTDKGENIYQILLDGKIDEVNRKRNDMLHQAEVAKAALKLLGNYRFTGEVPTPVERPYDASSAINAAFIEALTASMDRPGKSPFPFRPHG